jgi:putative membrane protein
LSRRSDAASFWRYALAYGGSATPRVIPHVLTFVAIAALVVLLHSTFPTLEFPIGPVEVSGAALALILILRTNSGYERWWEGRKLWGGIVNQSRNVVISGLAFGPDDPAWREELVRWTAAFPHTARRSLRGERDLSELVPLIGEAAARELACAHHMPQAVAYKLAALLHEARRAPDGLDGFEFTSVDKERKVLIDHVGGCERILKTPLAYPYAVMIRRFILVYLVLVPFGTVAIAGWATPMVTLLVAYPILALDFIGTDLQNPFSTRSLGHLPLDDICANIQRDVLALLEQSRAARTPSGAERAAEPAPH